VNIKKPRRKYKSLRGGLRRRIGHGTSFKASRSYLNGGDVELEIPPFDFDWEWLKCDTCRSRMRLDHARRMKICPKCGDEEEVPPHIWERMMLVWDVLRKYPPGQYLFRGKSLDEIVYLYLRELPEKEWFEWIMHDYVLAKFRHDEEKQKFYKEVVKEMARRMGYSQKWALGAFKMFEDIRKSADYAAWKIYNIAKQKLKVEGWRRSEDETVHDAPKKRILTDEEDKKNSEEFKRWDEYWHGLMDIYNDYWWRKDRVGCWLTRTVYAYVHREIYGTFDAGWYENDPLLDDEEAIIEGREETRDIIDLYVEDQLRVAEETYRRDKTDTETIAVMSILVLAAKLGYDVRDASAVMPTYHELEFAKEISEKIGDPEIFELFKKAFVPMPKEENIEAARRLLTKIEGMVKVMPSRKTIERANTYIS